MKTERVTLLTTPEFKQFLTTEAQREGVSVAELVRSRCEGRQSADEAMLASLSAELRAAVREAKQSLKRGLDEATSVLSELRAHKAAPRKTRKAAPRKTRTAARR